MIEIVLVVVAVIGVAPVADNVHSTDHLADGEETNNLGGGNTSESKLLLAGIANPRNDVLEREVLEGGGVASSVNQRLEVGLEGSQVGRSHVLATEYQLSEFEADLRVIDRRGYQRVDKGNDLPGSSTDLPQSATETLSSVRDRRTSRRSDTGETLGGLRDSRGGSLTGL